MLSLPAEIFLLILANNFWNLKINVVQFFTWQLELALNILWMIVARHLGTQLAFLGTQQLEVDD